MFLYKRTLILRVDPSLVKAQVTVDGVSLTEVDKSPSLSWWGFWAWRQLALCTEATWFPPFGEALLKEDLTFALTGPLHLTDYTGILSSSVRGDRARGWQHSRWISNSTETPLLPGALSTRPTHSHLATPMHLGQKCRLPGQTEAQWEKLVSWGGGGGDVSQ